MGEDINVVGVGPTGSTTAIILKREGCGPTVYEGESTFGIGSTRHFSVHATPINLKGLKNIRGLVLALSSMGSICTQIFSDISLIKVKTTFQHGWSFLLAFYGIGRSVVWHPDDPLRYAG